MPYFFYPPVNIISIKKGEFLAYHPLPRLKIRIRMKIFRNYF